MQRPIHIPLFHRALLAPALMAMAGTCAAQAIPDPMSMMGAPTDVARLSDADASCEQLYAEATWLETRIAEQPKGQDPMEAARQMEQDMRKAQQKMMGGARAKGLASSLLGMVPGVGGLAAGALSSMASQPNTDAMYDAIGKSSQAMQESMAINMRVAGLHARRSHLTNLFLERHCKVANLDRDAIDRAVSQLGEGNGGHVDSPQAAVKDDAAEGTMPH